MPPKNRYVVRRTNGAEMQVLSVDDVNQEWICQRVLALLDGARNEEAQAIAEEWDLPFDASDPFL